MGSEAGRFRIGDRVGVPWLSWAEWHMRILREGQENLCDHGRFTGYDVDGGYEEYQVTNEQFAYAIPDGFSDEQAAPLLCAGVVGYRALRLANAKEVTRLGMYGFGASAHISLQVARYWGVQVYVFTRSPEHRKLAEELGAIGTGGSEDDPGAWMTLRLSSHLRAGWCPLRSSVCVKVVRSSSRAYICTPIPQFDYDLLWGERVVRSVANATRQDAEELLALA